MTRVIRFLASALAAFAIVAAATSSAHAAFGIEPGTFEAKAVDDDGNLLTQAGAHPNATTGFMLNTTLNARGEVVPEGDLKDVRVDLPVGVVGNPTAAPPCQPVDFAQTPTRCPAASQVGVARILSSLLEGFPPAETMSAVYNLAPAEGQVAQFGFQFERDFVMVTASVRSDSDYGITATIRDIPGGVIVYGANLTFWGVPADEVHDDERYFPGQPFPGGRATLLPAPFFTNPTHCGPPPVTRIAIRSWQEPDRWVSDEYTSERPTGCDRLVFDPSISFKPVLPAAGAPSAYDVRLTFAQNDNPRALATSALRTAVVRLPAGVVTSPSSADGLRGCSPEQFGLRTLAVPTCPNASKIGTVSIGTPLLAERLTGSIFLADPTDEQLLRIYLFTQGTGVMVKLAGDVDPDPVTGQMTATFVDNPQLPVGDVALSFKGGPRAPLANPRTCGSATTTTSLSPWSGQAPATPSDSFAVSADGRGAPCPATRFAPSFAAGTRNPVAGAHSPLTVAFGREDADDYLDRLSISLPKGLLARIGSATLCAEAQANAGTCPEAARIGSLSVDAGPGSLPLQLPGRVYVTGAYKGGPFGLSIVVPAVAGPFDLGLVVVRAAIHVDKATTELRVVSDPLPTILKGIPLQVRFVDVNVDRAGFVVNPTSCASTRVAGTLGSVLGKVAEVTSRFQVGDCAALPFRPKLTLKAGARGRLRAGTSTPLVAALTMPTGQANNRSVTVILPKMLTARLEVLNVRRACSIEQYRSERCPISVGTASAVTPLLRDPLVGTVYLVRNPARRIPDVMVALKGQGDARALAIDVTGKVTVPRNLSLRTTFDTVPDAPITKFTLRFAAGRNGAIAVARDLCSRRARAASTARLAFVAQSGKRISRDQKVRVAGCGKAKPAGRSRGGKRSAKRR